jgi:hypothetical protein
MSSCYKSRNYLKLNIYMNSTSIGINGPFNKRGERNRKKGREKQKERKMLKSSNKMESMQVQHEPCLSRSQAHLENY